VFEALNVWVCIPNSISDVTDDVIIILSFISD
jgi:hypothetical protein